MPELQEGTKLDLGKDPWDLMPTAAIRQMVKVLAAGAVKYEPYNWSKGIKFSRLYAALWRHMTAWWEGEDTDPETGCSHLAHGLCCLGFLLSYQLWGMKEFDDRPRLGDGN